MRIELTSRDNIPDGRAERLGKRLASLCQTPLRSAAICEVLLLVGFPDPGDDLLGELFCDQVSQSMHVQRSGDPAPPRDPRWNVIIEVASRPGVTDPIGMTATDVLRRAGVAPDPKSAPASTPDPRPTSFVQSARQYRFALDSADSRQTHADAAFIAAALHNPLIERALVVCADTGQPVQAFPLHYAHAVAPSPLQVETFDLAAMTPDQLADLSRERLLSLEPAEMAAVRDCFADPESVGRRLAAGLSAHCTDVELEMIAQTWSEHCKHKIFQARIEMTEYSAEGDDVGRETIDGLFPTYIKRVTGILAADRTDLKSVFHDNAGVVTFDDSTDVCFKAETHNSPSALDPYGGAITGIVGVNRDILGTGKGAKPIFNTNVLCFGELDTPPSDIPEGLMHPRRVLDGVHHGIVDGGNQSGIPTVAGAVLFDDSYVGKPLVFCGTAGVLPAEINGEASWIKHTRPGHAVVMVGGRIGKDGIHGATFSSLALDESSPVSAVQIGDPITQRNMTDFLLEARDRGLYAGITDNGAGGLSSSLGEMALHSGGVRIELDLCPLKYPGLAPWEILVSESQERMSLSVEPDKVDALTALARSRSVEATVIGTFTDSGAVEIRYQDRPVGHLPLDFLHDGLPRMQLKATWRPPRGPVAAFPATNAANPNAAATNTLPVDPRATLLALLAEPNVASKEVLVRQYDHEVQAGSVIKPFVGVASDAPSDGAVVRLKPDSLRGLTVSHGICPRYGDADTYHMAMCAVDEAYRAHIALGGDPDRAYALDNFCWPDPVLSADTPDGDYKLAQLVRACRGLYDACLAYRLPLISGKDSMKNDARLNGRKVSVRPTLLISLMGIIEDITTARSSDFVCPGHLIYLLGETRGELGGTLLEKLLQRAAPATTATPTPTAPASPSARDPVLHLGGPPQVEPVSALSLYRALHSAIAERLVVSCHDLSDGGLAVALAESALGGRLGAEISLDSLLAGEPTALPVDPGDPREISPVARTLFCETPSRFLVSVAPADRGRFEQTLDGSAVYCIGEVSEGSDLVVRSGTRTVLNVDLDSVGRAFGRLNEELS